MEVVLVQRRMDHAKALRILSKISHEEVMEMDRKIERARLKVQARTKNEGKPFQEPKKTWHSRTKCGTCEGVHDGFRCPIGT